MVKLSVVMSVWNGAAGLPATLASIAAQTERDYELIAIDDGSTDDSPRILAEAASRDARIRVISQANAGLTRALIRGCREARAEVIARHDCGDRSHPERFARELAALRDDVVLVAAATRFSTTANEELYVSRGDGDAIRESLLHASAKEIRGIPHHATAMFRRAGYEAVGGYREQFWFAQDLDLWIRLAPRGRIVVLDDVLYEATLEPRSISSLHKREQEELTRIAVALRDTVGAAGVRPHRTRRPWHDARGLYFIAKNLRRRGNPTWRGYLLRALARNPLHWRAWASLLLNR